MQRPNDGAQAHVGPAVPATDGDIETDLCVIGAGSGGLTIAAVAAAFGRKVVLIEKHKMGGDCLNYGCVPSKALIAAARRAHVMRTADAFGIASVAPEIDHKAVHAHIRGVIDAIAPNDSVERFSGLGVRVIQAPARFVGTAIVEAGSNRIKARRFVVATGSVPVVPPISGLQAAAHFTNETIFDNQAKLDHLIVIGGGPIGLELAQAHLRLGSKVTVLEGAMALGKDDPELVAVVLGQLREEGMIVREGVTIDRVETRDRNVRVTFRFAETSETVEGTHILVAAGRRANLDGLNLEAAGIVHDKRGIKVNAGLVTSNSRVFAIGDCIGGLQFTHVASHHAALVIRRALFRLPAKVDDRVVPRVTFTDPELAWVGLTETQAKASKRAIRVLRWPFHENDRAQAERQTDGFAKVIADHKGVILGAGMVGQQAGELIQVWALAISQRLRIKAMMDWVAPYPTLGEINKRAATRYYATAPMNPMIRKSIDLLAKLG